MTTRRTLSSAYAAVSGGVVSNDNDGSINNNNNTKKKNCNPSTTSSPSSIVSTTFSTRYPSQSFTIISVIGMIVLITLLLLATPNNEYSDNSNKWFTRKSITSSYSPPIPKNFKLIQLQVIHRHGDRTPITPMSDRTYWSSQLPSEQELSSLNEDIVLLRNENEIQKQHSAAGDDVFGRLTSLGLQQMITVGQNLRQDLEINGMKITSPHEVQVASTNFPRTILSVRGVLHGLFQSSSSASSSIEIDLRHSNKMIPDPQPRLYPQQLDMETSILSSDEFTEKEEEMYPLAVSISNSLYKEKIVDEEKAALLSLDLGKKKDADTNNGKKEEEYPVLSWGQLAEIAHCLLVRKLLPSSISLKDVSSIISFVTWRWFTLLSSEELSKIAVKSLMKKLLWNALAFVDKKEGGDEKEQPLLYLFSGHDATLIGLMCGFQMEEPSQWPDYGSFLKVELLQKMDDSHLRKDDDDRQDYFLRFSLNNEVLQSKFGSRDEKYREKIPLEEVRDAILAIEKSIVLER